eukprot:g2281.t1
MPCQTGVQLPFTMTENTMQAALAAAGLVLPSSVTTKKQETDAPRRDAPRRYKEVHVNLRRVMKTYVNLRTVTKTHDSKNGCVIRVEDEMLLKGVLEQVKSIFGDDEKLDEDNYSFYLTDEDGFTLDLESPFYLIESELDEFNSKEINENCIQLCYIVETKIPSASTYNDFLKQLKNAEESVFLRELKTIDSQETTASSNENIKHQTGTPDRKSKYDLMKLMYNNFCDLRTKSSLSTADVLEKLGVKFDYCNVRQSLKVVKQHLLDLHVENCSIATYRLNIARASNNLEMCLEEKIGLNNCRSFSDVLEFYYNNRHIYDPHDVFATLVKAFFLGWEIQTDERLLNEKTVGNIKELETAIFMCVLVEYGVVAEYNDLTRFLLK